MTSSPSFTTAPLPLSGRDWVVDSPPVPGRALGTDDTINWGIFKRHFGENYSGINNQRCLATARRLELVQATRAFSFDGNGEAFRTASEAQRIRLAHLSVPLAVHSSRIEPLPHQITAVYGEMLPRRQPLRSLWPTIPVPAK